jgi:Big-like domain-containing protein
MDNGRRNIWNGTGTGNYWSNWVAPDKEPDSIVDMPYFISSESYFPADFYPLVDPIGSQRLYTPYNTTAFEDVEYSQRCFAHNLGEDLVWEMNSDANWLTFNTENRLVGRPDEDDIGDYWINISVSDDLTSLWRNFTLWVQNTNDAPAIVTDSLPELLEDEGFEIMFSVIDLDPTQDKCSFKVISDSDFIEIDEKEGVISGTPRNDDVGTHHLTLIVDDHRGGKDTRTYDLVVINSNDPPQIDTMISNTTCLEDLEFYLDLKGSDIDPTNDQLTWKMSSSCDFLVIDEDHGIIKGHPGTENVGKYSIMINLSDGEGGYDEISFVLEVVNVNDPPEISERPDPIILIEDQWNEDILDIRSLFIDPEGDRLTFLVTSEGPLLNKITDDNLLSLVSMENWSGDTEILIRASDGIASVDLTIPVKVLPENDVPMGLMIIFVDPAYHEGELGSMKAIAIDPDIVYGDSLTYQWSSDISGDLGSGKELIVELPHGDHMIKLTVSDSNRESVNITSKLVVFQTPSDPIIGGGNGGVDNLPTPGNVKIDPDRLVQEKSNLETFSVLFFLIMAGLLLICVIVQAVLSHKKAKTAVE